MASHFETSRRYNHHDEMLIVALMLSLVLHATMLVFSPDTSSKKTNTINPLTIALRPLPPEPLPPEPLPPLIEEKPVQEKIKQRPKKITPPAKPIPVARPKVKKPEPPPSVIAVKPDTTAPPPTMTTPLPELPVASLEPPERPEPPKDPLEKTPELAPSELPDLSLAYASYNRTLMREFSKYKKYPRRAQRRGWQGVVQVELQLDAYGNLASSNITKSSGFDILDNQALEIVRKATPLPLPPEVLRNRDFTIVVPVSFKLR